MKPAAAQVEDLKSAAEREAKGPWLSAEHCFYLLFGVAMAGTVVGVGPTEMYRQAFVNGLVLIADHLWWAPKRLRPLDEKDRERWLRRRSR